MSRSLGAAKFSDGKILFFEFNASSGYSSTALYETVEEVHDNWREDSNRICICGSEPETVRLLADYADGKTWDGKACRKCHAITDGWREDDVEDNDAHEGFPEWSPF